MQIKSKSKEFQLAGTSQTTGRNHAAVPTWPTILRDGPHQVLGHSWATKQVWIFHGVGSKSTHLSEARNRPSLLFFWHEFYVIIENPCLILFVSIQSLKGESKFINYLETVLGPYLGYYQKCVCDADGPIEKEDYVIDQAMMFMEAYNWAHEAQIHVRRFLHSVLQPKQPQNCSKQIIQGIFFFEQ